MRRELEVVKRERDRLIIERERDKQLERDREKELPSRPSGGTVLSMTPSSASSSFFHVASNSHTQADAARSDTLEATASHGGGEEHASIRFGTFERKLPVALGQGPHLLVRIT